MDKRTASFYPIAPEAPVAEPDCFLSASSYIRFEAGMCRVRGSHKSIIGIVQAQERSEVVTLVRLPHGRNPVETPINCWHNLLTTWDPRRTEVPIPFVR